MLNRLVLSQDRKTATEGSEVTRSGRLFRAQAAMTGKGRSPTVGSWVRKYGIDLYYMASPNRASVLNMLIKYQKKCFNLSLKRS